LIQKLKVGRQKRKSATLKTTLGLKLQEQIDSLKNPVEKNNKIKED